VPWDSEADAGFHKKLWRSLIVHVILSRLARGNEIIWLVTELQP